MPIYGWKKEDFRNIKVDSIYLFLISLRFRLASLPLSPSTKMDQDTIELKKWTDYCGKDTLQIKNGPLRSLPVLSKNGSHSLYWSKKIISSDGEIVNTDESLLLHSLQKLTNSGSS